MGYTGDAGWRESNTRTLALRSCWPGLAGDPSLGSAELVTFLLVVKNRRGSLKENQFTLLHGLRGGSGKDGGGSGEQSFQMAKTRRQDLEAAAGPLGCI